MAETVIGALSVKITADTKGVQDGVKATGKALKLSGKQLRENANKWGKWAAAAVAAAAGIAAAIVKSNLTTIRELKNQAFAANTTVEAFERGAFAAKQFGISQEKYGDILKDTNDRIGDFLVSGAGPMVDFFETIAPKIGITAEAFKGLSGEESLGLYIKSLQDAGVSQQEMTFFMEALASDSTRLVPLFQDNAKSFNALTKEAEALGIGLSSIDVEKAEMASEALDRAAASTDAMQKQLTVELAPIIGTIIDRFEAMAREAGGASNFIRQAIGGAINTVGVFADGVHGIILIFKGLEVAALGFSALAAKVFAGLVNTAAWMVDGVKGDINSLIKMSNDFLGTSFELMPLDKDSDFVKSVNAVAEGMVATVGEANAALNESLLDARPSEEMKAAVDVAIKQYERLAKLRSDEKENKTDGGGVGTKKSSEIEVFEAETIGLLEAMGLRFMQQEEMELAHLQRQREMINASLAAGELTQIQHSEKMAEIKQKEEDVKRQITLSGIQAGFQALASGSKKVEKMMKAVAIVQAVIKGKQAAVDAWQAGMSVGGPYAPVVAAAYTAASIANTASMINSIRGSGKSAPSPSAGVGGASSQPQAQQGTTQQATTQRNITIDMQGSGLFSSDQVRQLIGQINEQTGDGVELSFAGG